MSLKPLLDAPAIIQIHAFCALTAFVLGVVQLAGRKGHVPHRVLGWIWTGLMAVTAIVSFRISEIRQFGPFSLIHVLSIVVLATLPFAILAARRHNAVRHARAMTLLFAGALVIAGGFTLLPGRIMHRVVFGG